MKTRNCFLILFVFLFFENASSQTLASTGDNVAMPTTVNPTTCAITSAVDTDFPPPSTYDPNSSIPQLGINNTGTDICQIFNSSPIAYCQAMVWDKVTSVNQPTVSTPLIFTSKVFLSWKYNNTVGSFTFPFQGSSYGGYDPDVAIYSTSSGTFIQVVFENVTTGNIDGFSFRWDTVTSSFILNTQYKSTFRNDGTKKAKNPNIAVPKAGNGIAVVWHEEGPGPNQTLTITYNTTPPINFSNTVSISQSKVYIYCEEKVTTTFLGSPTSIINIPGKEVILTTPLTTNHLFDRNFNPDVSFSEERVYPTNINNIQRGISVVFVSEWFNPALFRIETGQLSVVQGTSTEFKDTTIGNVLTSTRNYISEYVGKPRIAARLSNSVDNVSKDFSVVMGNSVTAPVPCSSGTATASKLHNWWFQTAGSTSCPAGGVNLLVGTPYTSVTTVNPVVSCINGKGNYNVVFSTKTINGFDILANTYKEGASLFTSAQFSLVNYGTCSETRAGNQVVPSVASVRSTNPPTSGDAHSNYLFWDQNTKTVNYKKLINALSPGNGVALRLTQNQINSEFTAYPNPTTNEITFDYKLEENEKANEIEIFNMMGQSVDKILIEEDSNEQKRDVSKIPSGTYIAILKTNVTNHKLEFIKK